MQKNNFRLRVLVGGLMMAATLTFQAEASAATLTCTQAIGGAWNFGTAPSACNVSPLVSAASIKNQYPTVLYNDSQSAAVARRDFLSEMYPLLRDVGLYLFHRRSPSASAAEVKGFMDGVFALAHQESFWSHFRNGSDGVIRYMRGDSLHGHGLMQVDDRWHADALKQGKGVDLVYNMMFGLDIYYDGWVRSAKAACVASTTDYKSRARAAWAAYNGGPGAICRWKQSTAGDQQYLAKYNQRAWLSYVADPQAPVSLDVKCLVEGQRPCALPGKRGLASIETPVPPPQSQLPSHVLPGEQVDIVAKNGINLRYLENGKVLLRVPNGTRLTVDDISVQAPDGDTYLKVHYNDSSGFIYAGHVHPSNTLREWVHPISAPGMAEVALIQSRPYEILRQCAGFACAKNGIVVRSGATADRMEILQDNSQGWKLVRVPGEPKTGWIPDDELVEIHD